MVKPKDYIVRASELTAISVSRLIKEKGFTKDDLLTEEESKTREKLIDQAGVDAMRMALYNIPFVLRVVGSEGRKHIHQYGEALPSLEGIFGQGQLKLDCVNDVVEGSKAAKLNLPGAVCVLAVSSYKGLMPTPPDIDYMDKLFGPPQLKGKISIDSPVKQNLAQVVKVFGIKSSEINVVVMDRDRNAELINTCQKFGVNLILIQAGDFLPSILSCIDHKKHNKGIHLVMGIGGFEEGVMAAAAAKALEAVGEGRPWHPGRKKTGKRWTVSDLIPGRQKDCLVSISSITGDDKWFDLPSIKDGSVTSLTIDTSGVKIEKHAY